MHMQGEPRSMQQAPSYRDVVAEVRGFLEARIVACEQVGIPRARLMVDPGFGFGKTLHHNLALARGLDRLVELGLPVLVGVSRKSMIGALLGDVPVQGRLHGSVAAALLAAASGASVLRVHDVGPTVQALQILAAWRGS
jgi:dihydropteroate synthase